MAPTKQTYYVIKKAILLKQKTNIYIAKNFVIYLIVIDLLTSDYPIFIDNKYEYDTNEIICCVYINTIILIRKIIDQSIYNNSRFHID